MLKNFNKWAIALYCLAFKNGSEKKAVNMTFDLQSGGKVYVFSEDADLVGDAIVIADSEGTPTQDPAPDGSHVITNEAGASFTIEVAGGTVQTAVETQATTEEKKDEPVAEIEKKETEQALAMVVPLLEKLAKDVSELKDLKNQVGALKSENEKLNKMFGAVTSKAPTPNPAVVLPENNVAQKPKGTK